MHQKPWNAYDSPALQGGPGHPRGTTQRVRFKERRFAKGAESLGAMVEALRKRRSLVHWDSFFVQGADTKRVVMASLTPRHSLGSPTDSFSLGKAPQGKPELVSSDHGG
ncbi:MAG: hypothetical protein ACI8T1_005468 [Verrucomicrobiales bacterium]|jgi:hypothetical protein